MATTPPSLLDDILDSAPTANGPSKPAVQQSLFDDLLSAAPPARAGGATGGPKPPTPFALGGFAGPVPPPARGVTTPAPPLVGPSTVVPVAPRAPLAPAGPQPVPQIQTEEPAPLAPIDHSAPQGAIMLDASGPNRRVAGQPMGPITGLAQPPADKNDPVQALVDVRNLILGPAYGAKLKSDSGIESLVNGFVRAAASFNTPEGVAMMATTAGLGTALPELLGSAKAIQMLAEHPVLLKGLRLASTGAVPTAFAVMGGAGAAKNLYQGIKSGDREQIGQGIADLAIAGLAGYHAVRSVADEMGRLGGKLSAEWEGYAQAAKEGKPIDLIEKLRAMAGQDVQSPAEAKIARRILRDKYGIDIPEPAARSVADMTDKELAETAAKEAQENPLRDPKDSPVYQEYAKRRAARDAGMAAGPATPEDVLAQAPPAPTSPERTPQGTPQQSSETAPVPPTEVVSQSAPGSIIPRIDSMRLPDYVKDTLREDVAAAEQLGIVPHIEALASDRNTALETARVLTIPGTDQDAQRIVRSVRAVLGIPSMDDATEFERWRKAYDARTAAQPDTQPNAQPTPPSPVPAQPVAGTPAGAVSVAPSATAPEPAPAVPPAQAAEPSAVVPAVEPVPPAPPRKEAIPAAKPEAVAEPAGAKGAPPEQVAPQPLKTGAAPPIVYHGTGTDFGEFREDKAKAESLYGPGHYFTEDPAVASSYAKNGEAPNVKPGRLAIRNVFDVDAPADSKLAKIIESDAETNKQLYADAVQQFGNKAGVNDWLVANGYDGITHIGGTRAGKWKKLHRVWIALDPNQIQPAYSPTPETAAETPQASPSKPAAGSVVAESARGGEGEKHSSVTGTGGKGPASGAENAGRSGEIVNQSVASGSVEFQVLNPIISTVPVDVVNVLGGQQRATDMLLHEPSVLANALASDAGFRVPANIKPLLQVVARGRAKLRSGGPGSDNPELLSALKAFESHLGKSLSRLPAENHSPSSEATANAGAELSGMLDVGGRSGKGLPADVANESSHAATVAQSPTLGKAATKVEKGSTQVVASPNAPFAVIEKSTGKVISSHATRAEAQQSIAGLHGGHRTNRYAVQQRKADVSPASRESKPPATETKLAPSETKAPVTEETPAKTETKPQNTETTAAPESKPEPEVSPESRKVADKAVAKAVDDLIDAADRASRSTKSGSAMAEIEAERLRQFIRNGKEYAGSPLAKNADPKQVAVLRRTVELAEKVLGEVQKAAKPEPVGSSLEWGSLLDGYLRGLKEPREREFAAKYAAYLTTPGAKSPVDTNLSTKRQGEITFAVRSITGIDNPPSAKAPTVPENKPEPVAKLKPGARVQINRHTGSGGRPQGFGVIKHFTFDGKMATVTVDTGGEEEFAVRDLSASSRALPQEPVDVTDKTITPEQYRAKADTIWSDLTEAEKVNVRAHNNVPRRVLDEAEAEGYDPGKLADSIRMGAVAPRVPSKAEPAGAPEASAKPKPADLASALGFDADDIINAAAADLEAAKPTAKRPQPPPPVRRGMTPPPTPSKPANPLAAAAEAAEGDFLAKWGKKKGPAPVQSRGESPIDRDDLKNLTVMGARRILDGATNYKEWAEGMANGLGGALEAMAEHVGMTPAEVLRQIHQMSATVAKRFGVQASTPPAAKASTIQPEEQTNAEPALTEPAANESVSAEDRKPLAEQLPEADQGAGKGRPASGSGGARGKRVRKDTGAGATEDGVQPSPGTVSGVVGNPADPERTFPPRAQDVVSTRHDRDYRIPDGRVVSGSPEARAKTNIKVIRTLREIQQENRPATLAEMDILSGYVGWGAVPQLFAGSTPDFQKLQDDLKSLLNDEEYASAQRSTTNAHYTGDQHVDAIWNTLVKMGAKPGMSWMEPAVGIGTFFGRQPAALLEGARRVGIDKDAISGQIAKLLYPDSGIDIMGFEESELPADYFDGIASNVPFGDFGVHDPAFRGKPFLTSSIHNYYFAKSITLTRPGGIVAFITSRYTMDGYSKTHTALRSWLNERADFLGSVRLPAGAFRQNAGTDVITDIIFLRRRLPNAEPAGEDWLGTSEKTLKHEKSEYWDRGTPIAVNQYYHDHPEMVLGKEGLSRGQFSVNDYNVKGALDQEQLESALAKIAEKGGFQEYAPGKKGRAVAARELNAPEAITSKLGGLFFDDKGNLFRRTSKGTAEPIDAAGPLKSRIKASLVVRDARAKLLDAELADKPDGELKTLRRNLNGAYDGFVKSYGYLSSQANLKAMDGDPDAPLLLSLERGYNKGNKAKGAQPTAEKAPIFERRMLQPAKAPTSVSDPKEALYIALNEKGRLNWERMSELTGRTQEQLQSDLHGLVYRDPETKVWQTAEEYLSGSVRNKLKQARAIAKVEPEFKENVKALENVQPEDIPPGEIRAQLGVTWVPIDTYTQFAAEMLGATSPDRMSVKYAGGEWMVDAGYQRLDNLQKWSTARVSGTDLLRDTLNMRRTKVYDRDSDGTTTINADETKSARARQMEMQEHFEKWMFSEPKRGDQLARLYNDLHNDLRLRTYDGGHLTLPGMTRDAVVVRGGDLDPHQKAAVWRQIVQPNVLLAHSVGSGKTFEMIAAGMELKRLGLIRRPMYVVPNATLTGWQEQFAALYPQKRVLVFSEKDLERSRRQQIMAQIATGDWDAAVVPHSSFQFLPTGDDIFDQHYKKLEAELEESIKEAEDAGIDSRQIKRMEKAKERLLTSLKDKRNADKKDQTVTWEQLGIDQLFVDESHEYKKLGFSTKQGNVAGIDQNGNQKTFDLLMKLRYTQQHGRGVTFATGTPVTNTMGELFSIMKYLVEKELSARGMGRFDEWASNYGRTVDVFEPKIEGGGYQLKARFAQFVNLPELAQLFRSFADVVTSDMIDIPRPKIATGARQPVEQQLSDLQRQILEEDLQPRAKSIRANPKNAMPDNMLAVYMDAQKMALDPRMMVPSAPDNPVGRLNMAADLIAKHWKDSAKSRGTQLVFSDLGKPAEAGGSREFSVYDELIRKLIERGVPREEIAHIYQAKNKAQRTRLFQEVNDGKIRVLLGSTPKMGVGVNVQKKLYALHHLDIPHRPSDLEQREGRILRQGNENPEVHIHYYVTKGSLDEAKFGNVVRKAKFINQVMQGKSTVREAEDVGGMVPSLEMFQAMASGDPRVMRKMEVDAEVDRLSGVYSGWKNQQYQIRGQISSIQGQEPYLRRKIGAIQSEIATRDKTGDAWELAKHASLLERLTNKAEKFEEFSGEKISKDVNDAMAKLVLDVQRRKPKEAETLGYAYGLPIKAEVYTGMEYIRVSVGDYKSFELPLNSPETIEKTDFHRRVANAVGSLPGEMEQRELDITSGRRKAEGLAAALEDHWPYTEKLIAMVDEQKKLIKELGADKGDDAAVAVGDSGEVADARVEAQEQEPSEDEEDGEEDEDGGPKPPQPPVKKPPTQAGEVFRGNDPQRLASSLQPISAAPKPRLSSVWAGNVAAVDGAYVTDRAMAISVESIKDQGILSKLRDKKDRVQTVPDAAIQKMFDERASASSTPLKPLGYARVERLNAKPKEKGNDRNADAAYFADDTGRVYPLDSDYLQIIQQVVGPAEMFGSGNPKLPVAFKRNGDTLAILMPMNTEAVPLPAVEGPASLQSRRPIPGQPPRLQESPAPAGDFPTLRETKAYWDGAVAQPETIEGQPVLWVNGSAMDILLSRMGMTGSGQDSTQTMGLTMTPGEWLTVLDEARAAEQSPRPGGFDSALVRIGKQIEDVLRLNAPGVSRRMPLVVAQAGDSIKPEMIARTLNEELDHAKQMQLPKGLRGLPVEMLESPEGQKAVDALVKVQGYRRPDPKSPFYEHNRAVMTAEIGVRLMRGGRYQELGLTAEEAVELAAQYIEGLERENGANADQIIEQTYATIEQNKAAYSGRSKNLDVQHQTRAERAPQGRAPGATESPEGAVSGETGGSGPVALRASSGSVFRNLQNQLAGLFRGIPEPAIPPEVKPAWVREMEEFAGMTTAHTEAPAPLPENSHQVYDTETGRIRDHGLTEKEAQKAAASLTDLTGAEHAHRQVDTRPEPSEEFPHQIKESRLAKGIEENAVAENLAKEFANRPEYPTVNIKEQMHLAQNLIETDLPKAIRIVMRQEFPPFGLLPESVLVTLENYATNTRDGELLRQLAEDSPLSMEATTAGQRIRMLRERRQSSPIHLIQDVLDAREAASTKRHGPKAKEKAKTEIKELIKTANRKKGEWASFIGSIKC